MQDMGRTHEVGELLPSTYASGVEISQHRHIHLDPHAFGFSFRHCAARVRGLSTPCDILLLYHSYNKQLAQLSWWHHVHIRQSVLSLLVVGGARIPLGDDVLEPLVGPGLAHRLYSACVIHRFREVKQSSGSG